MNNKLFVSRTFSLFLPTSSSSVYACLFDITRLQHPHFSCYPQWILDDKPSILHILLLFICLVFGLICKKKRSVCVNRKVITSCLFLVDGIPSLKLQSKVILRLENEDHRQFKLCCRKQRSTH